ncbi:hypothetical protein [Neoaquamicrobium sediminum]|uniref:hypothetical protein n=1 Tax=Neoaquamicrobium sediminum TaxID=1849104 RepID=UPI001FCFEAF1|nr:hypothetical protein [Mesorhizobium sediminum]
MLAAAALAAIAVFVLYLCLVALAEPLLTVRDAFARTDVIVVLGETDRRALQKRQSCGSPAWRPGFSYRATATVCTSATP